MTTVDALGPLSPYHVQLLTDNYCLLLEKIRADSLIRYLVQNRVLTIPEFEHVDSGRDNSEKNKFIISYVYRKTHETFYQFLKSLHQSGHGFIANVLAAPQGTLFDEPSCSGSRDIPSGAYAMTGNDGLIPLPSSDALDCGKVCDKGSIDVRISLTTASKKTPHPPELTASVKSLVAPEPPSVAPLSLQSRPAMQQAPVGTSHQQHQPQSNYQAQYHTELVENSLSDDSNDRQIDLGGQSSIIAMPVVVHSLPTMPNKGPKTCLSDHVDKMEKIYGDHVNSACVSQSNSDVWEDLNQEHATYEQTSQYSAGALPCTSNSLKRRRPSTSCSPHLTTSEGVSEEGMDTSCSENDADSKVLDRCSTSPKCMCTIRLEKQILDTLELANQKLQESVQAGNIQEASDYARLVDLCFGWLKSLREQGICGCGVRQGCVLLSFKCESTNALDTLWHRWLSGQLKAELEEIFMPAFRLSEPDTKVIISVRMCSHQYLHYWSKLSSTTDETNDIQEKTQCLPAIFATMHEQLEICLSGMATEDKSESLRYLIGSTKSADGTWQAAIDVFRKKERKSSYHIATEASSSKIVDVSYWKRGACYFSEVQNAIPELRDSIEEIVKLTQGNCSKLQATSSSLEHDIEETKAEINRLESSIASLYNTISTRSTAVYELRDAIHCVRRKSRKRRKGGLFGAMIGSVLQPFTMGSSLTLAMRAAGEGTVSSMSQAQEKAEELDQSVVSLRNDVRKLEDQLPPCQEKRQQLGSELEAVKQKIECRQKLLAVLDSNRRELDKLNGILSRVVPCFREFGDAFHNVDEIDNDEIFKFIMKKSCHESPQPASKHCDVYMPTSEDIDSFLKKLIPRDEDPPYEGPGVSEVTVKNLGKYIT